MFITFYFIVTHLPDSVRYVKDHFLSLDPTSLIVDLLEEHLLAAETSAVAVGAARGTPRTLFFEWCSPSPLAPSYASVAAADVPGAEDVGVSSASAKCRSGKGNGGRVVGSGNGGGGGGSSGGGGGSGGSGGGGSGGGSGGFGGGGGGSGGSGGSGSGAIAIFDLDYGAILAVMYALSVSAEGDYYLCVPPDSDIESAALGASESILPGTAPTESLHKFTPYSDASHCFFHESTSLTPLSAPVPVRLADPSRGPVLARSSTVLPSPAVPSGSLSGLHLPSFSTNLVSTAALQDAMVTTTTPRGSTPLLVSPPVAPDPSVAPPPGSPLLATPSWHALPPPCLWSSQVSVPLPPSPTSPCLPFVEGRQRAAPHSSLFPPMTAPLQTLHMDVWGPARVSGQGRKRHILLSSAASALVAELVGFAATCRLYYATALVAESVSASPPSVGVECVLRKDVLEGRQKDFECLAAAVPRFASMLLAPEGDPDAPDIPTPRS
ncbi:unnamed protein product [Closterium sp. NIES-54]